MTKNFNPILKAAILILAFSTSSYGATSVSSYDEGVTEYRKGNYSEAVRDFRKSMAEHPGHTQSVIALASTLSHMGKVDESILLYRRALELDHNNVKVLDRLSDILSWKAPTRNEAIDLSYRLFQLQPKSPAASLKLAQFLNWTHRWTESETYYRKYLSFRPTDTKARKALLNMLACQDSRKLEAIHECDLILKDNADDKNIQLMRSRLIAASAPPPVRVKLPPPKDPYTLAREDYAKGYYVASIKEYKEFLHAHPDKSDARLSLAIALKKNGEIDAAVSEYRNVLKQEPENKTALFDLAEILSWKDSTRLDSVALYRKLVMLQPGDLALRRKFGMVESCQESTRKDAVDQLALVVATQSNDTEVLLKLAQCLSWNKQWENAERCFRQYLTQVPDDVSARLELAWLLTYEADNYRGALKEFETVLQNAPGQTSARSGRAIALTELGRYQDALPELVSLVELKPTNFEVWKAYAKALASTGNYEQALKEYDAIAKLCPEDQDVLLSQARVMVHLKRFDLANAEYDKLVKASVLSEANRASMLQDYGYCLFEQANYSASSDILHELLNTPDLSVDRQNAARVTLASIAIKQRDWGQAKQLLGPVIEANPESTDAHLLMAGANLGEGDPSAASQMLDKVPADKRDDLNFKKLQAEISIQRKEWAPASNQFQELVAYDDADPEIVDGLGTCLLKLKQYPAAERVYRRGLAKMPDDSKLQVGLSKALGLQGQQDEAKQLLLSAVAQPEVTDVQRLAIDRELSGDEQLRPMAVELSRQLISGKESSNPAKLLLAQMLSWDEKTRRESITCFREYLATNPKDEQARRNLADVLSWEGDRKKCVQIYAELLSEKPDDVDLLLSQARVLSWSGRVEQAQKVYKRVLSAQPDNRSALIGMAQCDSWSGCPLRAEDRYKKLCDIYTNDAEIQLERALNFKQLGRYDKASRYVSMCLDTLRANKQFVSTRL